MQLFQALYYLPSLSNEKHKKLELSSDSIFKKDNNLRPGPGPSLGLGYEVWGLGLTCVFWLSPGRGSGWGPGLGLGSGLGSGWVLVWVRVDLGPDWCRSGSRPSPSSGGSGAKVEV
uniref:Uncharacterized protein n=1 Tax=Cannabis sativa TaxID=3483 RepID=A0A803NN98_CANSA